MRRMILVLLLCICALAAVNVGAAQATCSFTKVNNLAAAGEELETEGGCSVSLKAKGAFGVPTKSEEKCQFGIKECWIIKGPATGTSKLKVEGTATAEVKGSILIIGSHLEILGGGQLAAKTIYIGANVFEYKEANPHEDLIKEVKAQNFQIQSAKNITIEKSTFGPSNCDPLHDGRTIPEKNTTNPSWETAGNNAIRTIPINAYRPENILIKENTIHGIQSDRLSGVTAVTSAELTTAGEVEVTSIPTKPLRYGEEKGTEITVSYYDLGEEKTHAQTWKVTENVKPGATSIPVTAQVPNHVYPAGQTEVYGPGECHTEGLAVFGGNGVTVVGNHFYEDSVKGIFTQNCCGDNPENLVFEKNWVGAPIDTTGLNGFAAPYFQDAGEDLSIESISNFELLRNHVHGKISFTEAGPRSEPPEGITGYLYGNVAGPMTTETCAPGAGITFRHNEWVGEGVLCNSGRNTDEAGTTYPFVNPTDDATLNYVLSPAEPLRE